MTGEAWALAALLCWHLSVSGGLPKEVPVVQARPWATGERKVRVLVFAGAERVRLRSDSGAMISHLEGGTQPTSISRGITITAKPGPGRVVLQAGDLRIVARGVRLQTLRGGTVVSASGGWGKRGSYPGSLELIAEGRTLRVINELDLEDYLAGVLAAELPSDFPLEAMKAQAIAARTYALFHLGDHAGQGADLCSRVHCQVYAGSSPEGSTASRAARETAGEVLACNGLLADALYHSACGGLTAAAWEVRQGKLLPYLGGGSDRKRPRGEMATYCGQERNVHWIARFTHTQVERLIASNLGIVLGEPGLSPGRAQSLRIASRRRGRVEWLEIRTTNGAYRVRGDAIRWLFGQGKPGPRGLRSTAFSLAVEKDPRGRPRAFVFKGVGHGHGIGLCQWGARGRAEDGQSAAEILSAYYPEVTITNLHDE